jgi:hypothetical protein
MIREKKYIQADGGSARASSPTIVQIILATLSTMPKRKVAALEKVEADLASLQYRIRRDPK